jgi:hypothetical protein
MNLFFNGSFHFKMACFAFRIGITKYFGCFFQNVSIHNRSPVIESQKWRLMETGRATPGDRPRDRAGKAPRRCKAPREDRTG